MKSHIDDTKRRASTSPVWQRRMANTTCLTLLAVATAFGQKHEEVNVVAEAHPSSKTGVRQFAPASIRALPGLECVVHPTGTAPSKGLAVFTDDDGYARFHAVRARVNDAIKQLTLDCKDSEGRPSTFSADLTSDGTFAPRPLDITNAHGTDRPALVGDPMSYTESELIEAGYGLRPDPKDEAAFSRWLSAASIRARALEGKRPPTPSHTVTTTTAPWWVGSVLTGAPDYISVEGTFKVPTAIPSGDETQAGTEIAIWDGLGGYNTGSGLIQAGAGIMTTNVLATYDTWREYCCGDPNSNGYGGNFTPNPGDKIYAESWYCDSKGRKNINGGYGCSHLEDETQSLVFSCTSPTGSPCWSVPALPLCSVSPGGNCMTLGLAAEFIIEDQSPQCCGSSTAFTDFTPTVAFSGSAYSSTTDSYSQNISSDSSVFLLTDFTDTTSHINVSLGTTDQTYFSMSQFKRVSGAALHVSSVTCTFGEGCYPESIGVGPNGSGSLIGAPWILGASPTGSDYPVYEWVNQAWVKQSGAGVMIAVSPNGYPWVVNHLGKIYYWNGTEFVLAPGGGCATAIAVGPPVTGLPFGQPWVIGCNGGLNTNGSIYQLQGSTWVKEPGSAVHIAVAPDTGRPWVLNAAGNIYYFYGSEFIQVAGCALSIGIGPSSAGIPAGNADPWIVGCNNEIYQMQNGIWAQIPGAGTQIAVSPDLGVPWVVNASGEIFE